MNWSKVAGLAVVLGFATLVSITAPTVSPLAVLFAFLLSMIILAKD